MKILKYNFVLIFSVILFGCNTEKKTEQINIKEKLRELTSASEYFTIWSNKDTVLIGKEGTKITISENPFCLENGDSITGSISIELREYYDIPKMLLSNLSTTSDGNLLETDGMLFIKATSNEKVIRLKEGSSVKCEMPTRKIKNDMSLFYGDENTNGQVNWKKAVNSAAKDSSFQSLPDTVKYSANNKLYNTYKLIKLGWVNCDRFKYFENKSEIFATVEGVPDTNIFCGLVLKNYNSILHANVRGAKVSFRSIPENEPAFIVSIGYFEGKYFFGISEITTQKNVSYSVILSEVSKDELNNRIAVLNENRSLVLN